MKKLLFFSVVVLLFSSCTLFPDSISKRTPDELFNSLKKPVVVVAKSDLETKVKDARYFQLRVSAAITLKDGTGKFVTFDGEQGLGASLFCTYNVNDTIK
jgi:hypothetical protein